MRQRAERARRLAEQERQQLEQQEQGASHGTEELRREREA